MQLDVARHVLDVRTPPASSGQSAIDNAYIHRVREYLHIMIMTNRSSAHRLMRFRGQREDSGCQSLGI